jgi:poly(beta-D-mannuronate) lyase
MATKLVASKKRFARLGSPWTTWCALSIGVSIAPLLLGRDIQVASMQQLQIALGDAMPGDKVVVADGKYQNRVPLKITKAGNKLQPIEIAAQSVGGVEINGSAGFSFSNSAAYVELRGFRFTHRAGTINLPEGTHHCRITRNVFELKVTWSACYLTVSGDDNEIDHNTFQNKKTEGKMLEVLGPTGSAMAQRTWIHHNYFSNFENSGQNNSSALHIGNSSRSLSPSHSLVEYNLFVKTRGENEGAICNKSCENTYRFNTFGQGCTELSLRHGNRCLVYGNFFIETKGGLRFFGDDHKIFCNYFQRNDPAVQIGNGDGNVPPAKLTSHDRPDRVQFAFNTLIDNKTNVIMAARKDGLGATHLVFAHNIIQGGDRAVSISGPIADASWTGNFIWQTNAGDIPANGISFEDPLLERTGGDIYRPRSGSPQMRIATKSFPDFGFVTDGQEQASQRGSGVTLDAYTAPAQAVLKPVDVGPMAR